MSEYTADEREKNERSEKEKEREIKRLREERSKFVRTKDSRG